MHTERCHESNRMGGQFGTPLEVGWPRNMHRLGALGVGPVRYPFECVNPIPLVASTDPPTGVRRFPFHTTGRSAEPLDTEIASCRRSARIRVADPKSASAE